MRGDPDQGVPVGQFFYPPYLFTAGGVAAPRPRITSAPPVMAYREHLDVTTDIPAAEIAAVVMLRSDHNTHSLTTGDRHVRLAFRPKGDPRGREIRVVAPRLPAQAVPGIYMLFVIDRHGVPSRGTQLRLKPETRGTTVPFR